MLRLHWNAPRLGTLSGAMFVIGTACATAPAQAATSGTTALQPAETAIESPSTGHYLNDCYSEAILRGESRSEAGRRCVEGMTQRMRECAALTEHINAEERSAAVHACVPMPRTTSGSINPKIVACIHGARIKGLVGSAYEEHVNACAGTTDFRGVPPDCPQPPNEEVTGRLPQGVLAIRIVPSKTHVTVVGRAPSLSLVAKALQAFNASTHFVEPRLVSVVDVEAESGQKEFRLRLRLRCSAV